MMKWVGVSARGQVCCAQIGGLVQDEGEGSRQAHFQRVDADLAVALPAMTVADREVRAGNPGRREQGRARA